VKNKEQTKNKFFSGDLVTPYTYAYLTKRDPNEALSSLVRWSCLDPPGIIISYRSPQIVFVLLNNGQIGITEDERLCKI